MRLPPLLLAIVATNLATAAFVGLGGATQEPYCANACYSAISSANLTCTMMPGDHEGVVMTMVMTTASCRSGDSSFLTTLAYCINVKCTGSAVWRLEQYWANSATGDSTVAAKWDYHTALEHVNDTPTLTWTSGRTLNTTMLAPDTTWRIYNHFLAVMDHNSALLYLYTLIILLVGFAIPIAITALSGLPGATTLADKINPYLVWPSTIGRYHVQPLPWLLGNPPTIGQALYIVSFFIVNVVLTCIGYESQQPHPWGYDKRGEILAYAGYRTGEIAFALLPLTILFASRNNILLWLTNWSHSTYLLLHRWIARAFALHTILHSVFLLAARIQTGTYASDKQLPYWQWGIVGTVFCCAMLVFSLLWFRRLSYELFLIGHIIMAIFVIAGSWYHLMLRFGYTGTHEYWLYAAFAVWAFDRILRVFRIARNGAQRATVTEIGSTHVRIDIPGYRFGGKPGYHGYFYFPGLNPLKPWENHPFSVNSTARLHSSKLGYLGEGNRTPQSSADNDHGGTKINESQIQTTSIPITTAGVTLYVRKSTGMTRLLERHASLLTLVDGPYPNNPPSGIHKCDRLVLIAGGIGITGVLGFLPDHANVKLAWTVKQPHKALVRELEAALRNVVDKEIRIGERVDVRSLLEREGQAGYERVGVVVSGPGALCDDVRAVVSGLGRQGMTVFELEVEAFGW